MALQGIPLVVLGEQWLAGDTTEYLDSTGSVAGGEDLWDAATIASNDSATLGWNRKGRHILLLDGQQC